MHAMPDLANCAMRTQVERAGYSGTCCTSLVVSELIFSINGKYMNRDDNGGRVSRCTMLGTRPNGDGVGGGVLAREVQ